MKIEKIQEFVFFMKYKNVVRVVGPAQVHGRWTKKAIPCVPNVATNHVKEILHRECFQSFFGEEDRKGKQGMLFLTTK